MTQINFYPESDKNKYFKAVEEYKIIWQKNGEKVVELIEKYSGMNFKTKMINAIIFDEISYSVPLQLEYYLSNNQKVATLVHELTHRLLMENGYLLPRKDFTKEIHKIIYLILFDIWTDLLGEKMAKKNVKNEIGYGDIHYKKAWDWALSFSKEKRKKEFEKMKLKYKK